MFRIFKDQLGIQYVKVIILGGGKKALSLVRVGAHQRTLDGTFFFLTAITFPPPPLPNQDTNASH